MADAAAARTGGGVWRQALFRGVSAAIVAVFSYSTVRLLPSLPEPFWAPIAALVVLYPDRQATRRAARDRFIGTVVGSLVGWGSAAWWDQNVVVYGLAVLAAVALCNLLRLESASRLCAVAVTVITVIPRAEPVHLVAFHRFVEVSYGVVCALLYTAAVGWFPVSWQRRITD
jgi:uncharacterized membrane protein YgaE (UPF0421/DUF939 family)